MDGFQQSYCSLARPVFTVIVNYQYVICDLYDRMEPFPLAIDTDTDNCFVLPVFDQKYFKKITLCRF